MLHCILYTGSLICLYIGITICYSLTRKWYQYVILEATFQLDNQYVTVSSPSASALPGWLSLSRKSCWEKSELPQVWMCGGGLFIWEWLPTLMYRAIPSSLWNSVWQCMYQYPVTCTVKGVYLSLVTDLPQRPLKFIISRIMLWKICRHTELSTSAYWLTTQPI